ncbi:hypothetical protein N3K66_008832 [Trichothecium roseum]|uniref:Uncharacterized protein n=1 Tax=Trichothecium roseum TaxID=47278 RepID=A0ACC0URB7_9HYPO|nr:hypothetical protein N3K66_008832 [Trichothecium roseum]
MLIQLLSSLAPAAKEHANTLCAVLASLSLAQLCALLWARNARRRRTDAASPPQEPEAHLRNLRRVGVRRSNMADQYDAAFGIPEDAAGAAGDPSLAEGWAGRRPRVKALFLHPVKSCAPVEVESAVLLKRGFEHDRCFALAVQKRPKPGKGDADGDGKDGEGEGGAEWRFVSQRTKPMMARIATELWFPRRGDAAAGGTGEDDRDGGDRDGDDLVRAGGCVVLRFRDPDAPDDASTTDDVSSRTTTKPSSPVSATAAATISLTVPLRPTAEMLRAHGIRRRPFGIHDRTAVGLDMSPFPSVASALPKLKRFLKLPEHHGLALLSCNGTASDSDGNDDGGNEDAMLSRTSGNLAPLRHIGTPSVHGYTDDQPLNVNSLASVHAVSALLPPGGVRPLNALRFRANVWVAGSPAFDEETWKRFRFVPPPPTADDDGDDADGRSRRRVCATISAVCRTSRCTMPNVDPDRGVMCAGDPPPGRKKGRPQPSATLVEHRSIDDGNKGALGFLGVHCVPEDRSLAEAAAAAARRGAGSGAGLVVRVGDEVEVLERGTHLFGSTANEY